MNGCYWVSALHAFCSFIPLTLLLFVIIIGKNDYYGSLPIHIAAETCQVPFVKSLLATDVSMINVQNNRKQAPIHLAAKRGHKEMIAFLLQQPSIDVNIADEYENLPIHYTARTNLVDCVKCLLARDVTMANIQNKRKETPLHLAAKTGKKEMVDFLLQQPSTDTNIKDRYGELPIHCGVRNCYIGVVKSLLSNNISMINSQNKRKQTPLHIATLLSSSMDEQPKRKMVMFLLNQPSIDVRIRDITENLPIHNVVDSEWDDIEIIKLLLSKDVAMINAQNQWGESPLEIAMRRGCHQISNFLSQQAPMDNNSEYLSKANTQINSLEIITRHVYKNSSKDNSKKPLSLFTKKILNPEGIKSLEYKKYIKWFLTSN